MSTKESLQEYLKQGRYPKDKALLGVKPKTKTLKSALGTEETDKDRRYCFLELRQVLTPSNTLREAEDSEACLNPPQQPLPLCQKDKLGPALCLTTIGTPSSSSTLRQSQSINLDQKEDIFDSLQKTPSPQLAVHLGSRDSKLARKRDVLEAKSVCTPIEQQTLSLISAFDKASIRDSPDSTSESSFKSGMKSSKPTFPWTNSKDVSTQEVAALMTDSPVTPIFFQEGLKESPMSVASQSGEKDAQYPKKTGALGSIPLCQDNPGSQAVNPVNRVHKAITKTKPGLSISQAAQKYLETHNSPWQNAQFLEQASSHKQQMSKNPGPEIVPDILNHVIQPNTHRLAQRGHSEKNVLQSQTIQLDSSSEEEGENSREGKPSRESAMTSLWSLRTSPDVQMCVSSTTKAKDEKASGSSTDVEMVLNGAGQQTHLVQNTKYIEQGLSAKDSARLNRQDAGKPDYVAPPHEQPLETTVRQEIPGDGPQSSSCPAPGRQNQVDSNLAFHHAHDVGQGSGHMGRTGGQFKGPRGLVPAKQQGTGQELNHAMSLKYYKPFKKQQDALNFAHSANQTLIANSPNGVIPASALVKCWVEEIPGRNAYFRSFLIASAQTFWSKYRLLASYARHCYEVIENGAPCHLYFDLEFEKAYNGDLDGDAMICRLIEITRISIRDLWDIALEQSNIVELDSSTDVKFSKHLIVKIPGHAFEDNSAVGSFVHQLLGMPEAASLTVRKNSPNDAVHSYTSLVDAAVYTKNRHFRLIWSSKGGKKAILMPTQRTANGLAYSARAPESQFLGSLVTLIEPTCNLLTLDLSRVNARGLVKSAGGLRGSTSNDNHDADPLNLLKQDEEDAILGQHFKSDEVQRWAESARSFIEEAATKLAGGAQAYARSVVQCGSSGIVAYGMLGPGSHYCENVGRCHKSNHNFFVANFVDGVFCQKCHDPDCSSFRSAWMPLPERLCPLRHCN